MDGAISIHAPRVRCDRLLDCLLLPSLSFQSTHLVWGATCIVSISPVSWLYFNPRTSCEVRHGEFVAPCEVFYISIHAPRVRCDQHAGISVADNENFNPRTSCEVRLRMSAFVREIKDISIHAPRVRCDSGSNTSHAIEKNFNPRTSCEVRLRYWLIMFIIRLNFNPRTSCEVRHHLLRQRLRDHHHFNPRTSCEVRPKGWIPIIWRHGNFNPRTSCEVRLKTSFLVSGFQIFQSTHLVWGATCVV